MVGLLRSRVAFRAGVVVACALGAALTGVIPGIPESVAVAEKGAPVRVVGMQRAIDESQMGKELRNQLESEAKALKVKLDQGRKEFEDQRKKLEAQRSVLSADAFAVQAEKVTKAEKGLNDLARESQMELAKSRNKKLKAVVEKIDVIIADYAKESKVRVVLENDGRGVLYAADWMDITDEVIARLNKQATGL